MRKLASLSSGLVGAALILLGAPAAQATTVSANGLFIVADPGEQNQITVTQSGASFVVTDTAPITNNGMPSCATDGPNQVTCMSSGAQPVNVHAGDGNDRVTMVGVAPLVSGGAGDDVLDASQGAGTFAPSMSGFAGNDTLIGTSGADILDSGPLLGPGETPAGVAANPPDAGDDTLIGNAGNDYLSTSRGADTADGGEGDDYFQGSVVPYDFPTPPDIKPTDDNAVDNITCGPGTRDAAVIFAGDQVGIDCEQAYQFATCPESASQCSGTAEVSASGGGSASGASAAAAGSKSGKKSLGKSRKTKFKGGQTKALKIPLKGSKLRRAIGKRSELRATVASDLVKMKGGKEKGHVRRRSRFKFKK